MFELPPSLKKFKIALGAGLVIVLSLAFFAIRFGKVSESEDRLTMERDEVRKIQRNIENGENIESQLAEIERLTGEIRARTIVAEDASVNKAYFYGFETPQLKLQSVEQRNLVPAKDPWTMKNFDVVEFTITATGTYSEVLDLAYRIRGGSKLTRITELSITREGQGEQRQIALTLEAIARHPKEEEKDA